jgi:hypothetical protein
MRRLKRRMPEVVTLPFIVINQGTDDEWETGPAYVNIETSPPEPDVNWAGGLEILSVFEKAHPLTDLLPQLSATEQDRIFDEVSSILNAEGEDYGDY